MDIEVSNKQ